MKKYLVVDTNVWLLEPNFYEYYKDEIIVVPQTVIEELDSKKSGFGNLAINARKTSKVLDKVSELYQNTEEEKDFVNVELNGHKYKFKLSDLYAFGDFEELPLDLKVNDNKIIANALLLKDDSDLVDVSVLSNDCNVRCKVGLLYNEFKVKAIPFDKGAVENVNEYYSMECPSVTDEQLSKFYSKNLKCKDLKMQNSYINMPVYLQHKKIDGSIEEIMAYVGKEETITPIEELNENKKKRCNIYKIKTIDPINRGQKQLVRAIKDENIKIVSCFGRTGSGKSLVSLATAMQLQSDGDFAKIHLIKAYQPIGNTVGMLKGSLEDKIAPIKASFEDCLEVLGSMDLEKMEQMGIMTFSTPEFERGRTRHSTLVIVDEAQNMSPLEIKTLITRCGQSSKIVLLGDLKQIDNKFLTESFNGLAHATDKLTGQDFFSVVYLDKSERADFLNIVDELL